ncbi:MULTISPECIES: methylmalonyl Co-A mutase-associated GTPase MeaB [Bacillaceae]|uniref:ATPase/protein kinase n=1 Tax=Gottfriedia luciferensis TaxID=178774 RepID=A0ABX2ZW68_9BACI|nr:MULTISPECIES: methylmalonyl Co-A mutase-associated GTPase MeaB [Bacillaceae]ODG93981.1 ATPase/protein kinase [Gottfriedia luciferensis]PGZ86510.1 methylmalonyl Co-A mutase-associated GTPase MeaB [Bacillus sp. AFS029533]SFC34143.1 methylmalonyl-CoA mutase metallochaperone MeaB [Bacillus sp. UNCCL81]
MDHENKRKKKLSEDDYVNGVLEGNRTILAQTITLIESNSSAHMNSAQNVLTRLLPHSGRSIRIGITGVPGAGKSSLIESFGTYLCEQGHKVAVLTIDPSSTITKGSILGDKTRMDSLSKNPNAFIRPSASGGSLGGIARKTRESMLVCEAAGYDVILIETVGVGQSEVQVRSMVDFFLLVMLTGAGDELQGIKKGIMELADSIVINKADGQNKLKAKAAKAEFNRILHLLQPSTPGWSSKAYTASALLGEGIEEIWNEINAFKNLTTESGYFSLRRQKQMIDWMYNMVFEQLKLSFMNHESVKLNLKSIESSIVNGELTATSAANYLLSIFESNRKEPL